MKAAELAGELRVLKEPAEIKWLATYNKSQYVGGLLEAANKSVEDYIYDIESSSKAQVKQKYLDSFSTNEWSVVLSEINTELYKG